MEKKEISLSLYKDFIILEEALEEIQNKAAKLIDDKTFLKEIKSMNELLNNLMIEYVFQLDIISLMNIIEYKLFYLGSKFHCGNNI